MIVRIMGEGQYRLEDGTLERLSQLDQQVVEAIDASDEAGFQAAFSTLVDFVRHAGERVRDDQLAVSDHVLPHTDTTLAEARDAFAEEGAIPG
jgi:hypothetical protein